MDLIKKYGDLIKKEGETDPEKALDLIRFGLRFKNFTEKHIGTKGLPAPYETLFMSTVRSVLRALGKPERSVWSNIFGPFEIFQCFDLQGVSVEALATFLSGFGIEDYFIDRAEAEGIASTLCSYHKNFMGGVYSDVLPTPAYAVTTTTVCDGNLSSFRLASMMRGIDLTVLDVPHKWSPEGEKYLAGQLREMTADLERITGRQFDINELKAAINRENESKKYFETFLEATKEICYPNTLALNMCMLFATHLNIDTQETLDFFKALAEDVNNYKPYTGSRIMWIHLQPFYDEVLKEIFNISYDNNIQVFDFNMDYMDQMDEDHPFEAIARKMIDSRYNGDFSRKMKFIGDLMDEYRPDGAIHYCHWGCKQSSGGVMQIKEVAAQRGIPLLILDGDAIDRRNSHEGQIRTRTEAFIEMLGNRRR